MAARHYGICKIELAVEFKRARLGRKGPRGRVRLGRFVDYAYLDAELGKRARELDLLACTDDQNIAAHVSRFSTSQL
jgi:hypothetical protein